MQRANRVYARGEREAPPAVLLHSPGRPRGAAARLRCSVCLKAAACARCGMPRLRRLRSVGDGVSRRGRFLRQVTAVDGALPLDGDVGLDALDKSHVEVTEVLHLVLHSAAGVALALTLLLADALRLALFADLRLAARLCERRLLFASQG